MQTVFRNLAGRSCGEHEDDDTDLSTIKVQAASKQIKAMASEGEVHIYKVRILTKVISPRAVTKYVDSTADISDRRHP
jgi:hypothetical protein